MITLRVLLICTISSFSLRSIVTIPRRRHLLLLLLLSLLLLLIMVPTRISCSLLWEVLSFLLSIEKIVLRKILWSLSLRRRCIRHPWMNFGPISVVIELLLLLSTVLSLSIFLFCIIWLLLLCSVRPNCLLFHKLFYINFGLLYFW
jgi:hypothetical protein